MERARVAFVAVLCSPLLSSLSKPTLTEKEMMTDENIMALKQLADGEDDDNRLEQKRRHGDAVVYGQTVGLWRLLPQTSRGC